MNPYTFILDSRIIDLADNYPWIIPIIDTFQMDTDSSITVAEIAENKNINIELLVEIITNAIVRGIPEYTIPTLNNGNSINDTINYIITHHHLYLRTELPRLIKSTEKVIEKDSNSCNYLAELLLFLQGFDIALVKHLNKEEIEVFPFITHTDYEVINDGLRQAILLMEFEHNHVSNALNHLSLITDNFTIENGTNARMKELIASLKMMARTFDEHLNLEEQLIHDLIF